MKKNFLATLLIAVLLLSGCGNTPSKETGTINVFAAASMTETLTEMEALYEASHEGIDLVFTFDSSGTLKTQIEQGAACDIFISAAAKQMNSLEELNMVVTETRSNLLENKVVLVVPAGNPAGVETFDDVNTDKVNMIALGNSDVPVGQYSEELFTSLGVWEAIQPKITFGSNVKEVTTQVSEGLVDCGVVYATDALAAELTIITEAPEGTIATPVIYPIAQIKNEQANASDEAIAELLEYIKTNDEAAKIFEAAGFTVIK